jgi:hypothetical protein
MLLIEHATFAEENMAEDQGITVGQTLVAFGYFMSMIFKVEVNGVRVTDYTQRVTSKDEVKVNGSKVLDWKELSVN